MNSSLKAAKSLSADDLSPLPITYRGVIDEEYLDSNGHMNVSWYLHLFNRASGDMYKKLGFDWRELREQGCSSFSLEGHVRYFSEMMMDENVSLRTRLVTRSEKRIHWLHFMFNEDRQRLSATYEEVMGFIDMNARRMTPYPDSISKRLDEMLSAHQSLPWDSPVCGAMRA